MNVTPLVDVVLVLLIIFMVVAPVLARQFRLSLPRHERNLDPAGEGEATVVVTVTGRGELRIGSKPVVEADFPGRLQSVLAARGERTVLFDAHDDVSFARAARAMELARKGGASVIAVSSEALEP